MRTGSIAFGPSLPFAETFEAPRSKIQDQSSPRKEIIDAAFERADAAFIERYSLVLVVYGKGHADFIAGDVTAYYVKNYGPISPSQKKALGGLYQRLQRSGVIEKTGGYRARDQGNASAVYRLKG